MVPISPNGSQAFVALACRYYGRRQVQSARLTPPSAATSFRRAICANLRERKVVSTDLSCHLLPIG